MGCIYRTKNMGYDDNDYGMKILTKEGNKSINGLINKSVVVKRRRYKR